MRSGLFWKLFLLQMLAAATLLGGALYATRMYSIRHFGEFIEKHDRQQMRELAEQLARAYAGTDDLAKAAESVPLLWRRLHMRPGRALLCEGPECPPPVLLRDAHPQEPQPPDVLWHEELEPPESIPFPPPDGENPAEFEQPVPGDEMGLTMAEEPPDGGPPRIMRFRGRGTAGAVRVAGPMPPLQLLDAQGQRVLGVGQPLGADAEREPVLLDGKVIAYLARPRLRGPPEQLEFARKELRRHLFISPIALAVAAIFALLTTALIVRPIRRLSRGTAALARREFGTRLPEDRRDELGALARDFNRLAEALQGYDTRQRQWVADISHELRTPVAVLRGELEALIDGVRTPDGNAVRSLREEVRRLEALIQDLHLVSVAESGGLRLNFDKTDVGALTRQSAERLRERLRAKGFALQVDVPTSLAAEVDAQRIDQVLANLLENALRHANPPGPITVSARKEPGAVVITVADAGPGVPPDALPRLFDRLYRVESSRTRGNGGAGLGLAICKSIVEAHGGWIEARGSSLGGLEIVVRIPVAAMGRSHGAGSNAGAPHGRDR